MKLFPVQITSHIAERLASVIVSDKGVHALSTAKMLVSAQSLSVMPTPGSDANVGDVVFNSFLSPNVQRSINRLLTFEYTTDPSKEAKSRSLINIIGGSINEINIFANIRSVIPTQPASVVEGQTILSNAPVTADVLKAIDTKVSEMKKKSEDGDMLASAPQDVVEALKMFIADLHLDAKVIDDLSSDSNTTVSMRLVHDKLVSEKLRVPVYGELELSTTQIASAFTAYGINSSGSSALSLPNNGSFDDYSRMTLLMSKIARGSKDDIIENLRKIMYTDDHGLRNPLSPILASMTSYSLITDLTATSKMNTAIVAIQAPAHLENYVRSVLQVCDRVEIVVKARLFVSLQPIVALLQIMSAVLNSRKMLDIMSQIAPDAFNRLDVGGFISELESLPVSSFVADVLEEYSALDGLARNGVPDDALGLLGGGSLFPTSMVSDEYLKKLKTASFVLSSAVTQFVQFVGLIMPLMKNKHVLTLYNEGSVHFNTRKLNIKKVVVDVDNVPILSSLIGKFGTYKPAIEWTGPECGHFFFFMPEPFNVSNSATHLSVTPEGLEVGSLSGEVLPYALSKMSNTTIISEFIDKAKNKLKDDSFSIVDFWSNPMPLSMISRNVPLSYPSEFLANVDHKYILRPDQCPLPGIAWRYAGKSDATSYAQLTLKRSVLFESIVPGEKMDSMLLSPSALSLALENNKNKPTKDKMDAYLKELKNNQVYSLLFHYDEASFIANVAKHPFFHRLANYDANGDAVFNLPFFTHHEIAKLMGHYALVQHNPLIAPLWIDIPQRVIDSAWLDWSQSFFDDLTSFARRDIKSNASEKIISDMGKAFSDIRAKVGRTMFVIEPRAMMSNISDFSKRSVFNDFAQEWSIASTLHSSKAGQDKLSSMSLADALE